MQAITAVDLLNLWEHGTAELPYVRALNLLAMVLSDLPREKLTAWSLGKRDDALLSLQEQLFGDHLVGVSACPSCKTRLEMAFKTADIRTSYADSPIFSIDQAGLDGRMYALELSPVSTRDLIAVAGDPSRNAIVRRCIVSAQRDGQEIQVDELSPDLIDGCEKLLAGCDPQADIRLALTCPECERSWEAPFDILNYLWREIDMWAQRTLQEIHLLASAYGWSEDQILRLSARRRRLYLNLILQ